MLGAVRTATVAARARHTSLIGTRSPDLHPTSHISRHHPLNQDGDVFVGDYELIREVRRDMYGIRTFLRVDGEPVKFEIISEGRLSLAGAATDMFPVDALDHTSCIAEKLLAHADCGS